MRRDHLIMAALYDRAKDIDSRSPDIIMYGMYVHHNLNPIRRIFLTLLRIIFSPDGVELHETTAEYLKLFSCWKKYGGKERWNVFQKAKKVVEARMVWVSDSCLDSREHLQTGSPLMRIAEEEFMNAVVCPLPLFCHFQGYRRSCPSIII